MRRNGRSASGQSGTLTDVRPVGIFDSGLGGLTVAAAVRKRLPAEHIVYLGDTARVPYGNRSAETITRFALQDAEHLAGHGVKAIVAACNTVSATALDALHTRFPDLPVLGVIEPGADAAAKTGARRIAVLGTRATIRSGAYARALLARDPSIRIEMCACPLFVPLVEEGVLDGALTKAAFDLYLHDLKSSPPDAVLLGCTHYPLLKASLQAYFGNGVTIIDSAEAAAAALERTLKRAGIAAEAAETGDLKLFVSDIASGFREQASRFLNADVPVPEKAELG